MQGKQCEYNFAETKMSNELNDRETVSVLCLDFVDKEYRLFVIGYFLRIMARELDRKRRKVVGLVREASEFFRVTDTTVIPDRYKVFKGMLSQYIRMGRRGMHLLLDTQSPNETRGILDGQQDLTILGRLPSDADRRTATEQLYRDGLITTAEIKQLGFSEPGEFVFCPSGKKAFSAYVMLPRSRYWHESYGNFYKNVWDKEVNKYQGFIEEIDKLKEKYIEDQKTIKEEKRAKEQAEKDKKKKPKENIQDEYETTTEKIDTQIEVQPQEFVWHDLPIMKR